MHAQVSDGIEEEVDMGQEAWRARKPSSLVDDKDGVETHDEARGEAHGGNEAALHEKHRGSEDAALHDIRGMTPWKRFLSHHAKTVGGMSAASETYAAMKRAAPSAEWPAVVCAAPGCSWCRARGAAPEAVSP